MKIFLDFDDTLFNTSLFFQKLQRVYESLGVSSVIFQETYQEIKKEHVGKWVGYSPLLHIKKLQECYTFDGQKAHMALTLFLADTSEFIFPDGRDFLAWCREQGHEVCILSFGDREFQTQKIRGAQLSSLIQKIIVTESSKSEALLYEGFDAQEQVWFFDDRRHFLKNVKEHIPFVQTVLVTRPEGRYADELSAACDYQVSNLEEGKRILEESQRKS